MRSELTNCQLTYWVLSPVQLQLNDLVPDVMPIGRVPVLEVLEVVECLFPVEQPDVLGLGCCKSADGPAQMNEVRLDGRVHRVHPDLARKVVRLPGVAGAAGGHDVGPVVGAAAGEGDEVVARQ